MTEIREVLATPDMPGWVRAVMALAGLLIVSMAAAFAQPALEAGWTWTRGLATVAAVIVGADLLHAGARKRWPLVFFVDLLVARLVSGRWS